MRTTLLAAFDEQHEPQDRGNRRGNPAHHDGNGVARDDEVKAGIGAVGVRGGDHKKKQRCNDCKGLHDVLPENPRPTFSTIVKTEQNRANGPVRADCF